MLTRGVSAVRARGRATLEPNTWLGVGSIIVVSDEVRTMSVSCFTYVAGHARASSTNRPASIRLSRMQTEI